MHKLVWDLGQFRVSKSRAIWATGIAFLTHGPGVAAETT